VRHAADLLKQNGIRRMGFLLLGYLMDLTLIIIVTAQKSDNNNQKDNNSTLHIDICLHSMHF
jgi:hypothetical protein